ncbi:myosin-like coiled-coil protein-domain-containing protein [Cladochytrium replicatum]|nr:myosin-like coiled-coil protein-domain-containing protein [Cladochytrium replicatum]
MCGSDFHSLNRQASPFDCQQPNRKRIWDQNLAQTLVRQLWSQKQAAVLYRIRVVCRSQSTEGTLHVHRRMANLIDRRCRKDMGFAAPSAQQNKLQPQPGSIDAQSIPPAPLLPSTQNTSQHQQPQNSSQSQQHTQNQLKPEDLGNLIQSKIGQLETEAAHEEEEERAIARAVKKASKDMAALISSTSTHTDKLELYHTKYIEEFQETRRLEKELAKSKRKVDLVTKEKDTAKSDLVKVQNQKQKIETLCRELQKENKRIKEESKRLAITEQQKREELSSKFESTIGEIKNKMEEDSDEKRRRAEDNELLKEKFKELLEQYDIRERHFQSAMQNKDLELQLREAKLEQQRQISEQEALRNAAFKSQIASFIATETELRRQLSIYVEKFKQVRNMTSTAINPEKLNGLYFRSRKH